MAHELDRRAGGTAAMFSVRLTPWHREGTVLHAPPSVDAAIRLAGLDFHVGLRPLYTRHGAELRPVPGFRATYRTDRDETLGVVRERYTVLQNRDAFRAFEPLVQQGLLSFETAGSLRGGRDVWILVRFNLASSAVADVFRKEVVPYGLLSNNHAGQRGVMVQETPIRVVCANTLGIAQQFARSGHAVSVRHTLAVGERTAAAVGRLWRTIVRRYERIAGQYRLLQRCRLTPAEFRTLVQDVVAPLPPRPDGRPTTQQEQAMERAAARRTLLLELWFRGDGHRGDGSAWEAYNAAVQALDHRADLWPTRATRVQSLFDGSIAARKQRVLNGLVARAAAGAPDPATALRRGGLAGRAAGSEVLVGAGV